jgi:hypothetical protein
VSVCNPDIAIKPQLMDHLKYSQYNKHSLGCHICPTLKCNKFELQEYHIVTITDDYNVYNMKCGEIC